MLSGCARWVAGWTVCLMGIAPGVQADGARTGAISILEIPLSNAQTLQALQDGGYDVASVHGAVATVYASQEEVARLRAGGFAPVETGIQPDLAKVATGYHTYSSLTTDLQAYAAAHTDICRLISLGKSAENRNLWAMLITKNPDIEEDEPEFKYVSSIHGDEPVGMENCLQFINLLLSNYGSTSRITNLIDTTAIWIVPLMNPDGWQNGTRNNAAGYNLNREFPAYPDDFTGTFFDDGVPDISGYPVEVGLMMAWSAAHHFVASANFHGGACVVNYPYDDDGTADFVDAPTPDDALFRDISLRYSINNSPMYNSSEFTNGITNGAAWYVVEGGMQDWNYRYLGCNEVTIELYNTKTPASSLLTTLWNNNKESMLVYLEAVHMGVRGIITDRATGEPMKARVHVRNNAHLVFTDPAVGDYHRMLLPGTYTLVYSAPGYAPVVMDGVTVSDGSTSRVDVTLASADVNGDGEANAADVQRMVNNILGKDDSCPCDLDGGGVGATDLQGVINAVLGVF